MPFMYDWETVSKNMREHHVKGSRRAWPPMVWIESAGEGRYVKHTANGYEPGYVPNHEDKVSRDWYEV